MYIKHVESHGETGQIGYQMCIRDRSISMSELYEAMGYADAVPDEAVEKEVRGVLGRVEAVTSPRFLSLIHIYKYNLRMNIEHKLGKTVKVGATTQITHYAQDERAENVLWLSLIHI